MAQFVPGPAFAAELERLLAPKARIVAETVADFLREKLSDENAPSSPGDYPAKISGKLVDSISFQEVAPGKYEAGSFETPIEGWYLEYPAPEGSPYRKLTPNGARPWASKALLDAELHARIVSALKGG